MIAAFQQSNKTQLNRHWSPFPTFFPTYVYKQKYNQAYLFYKIGLVKTNQLCMLMLESSVTHKSVISCLSLTNLPSAAVGDGDGTLGEQRQADLCEFPYLVEGVFLKHTTACLNRLDFFLLFQVGNICIFLKMHLMSRQSLPDPHLHNFIPGYQTKLCPLEYYSCRNSVPKKLCLLKAVTSSTWLFISLLIFSFILRIILLSCHLHWELFTS